MFSKKFSSKEGITLIALVVTIVVLIILATISINAVLGQNGIIGKAKQAKESYEKSVKAEDTAMQELLNEMAQYDTDNSGSGGETTKPAEGITVTVGGQTETITKDNVADCLGKVVTNYVPTTSSVTIGSTTYNVSTKYRLYYVDFEGKYGEKNGVYLKADCTSNNYTLPVTDTTASTEDNIKIKALNPLLYNQTGVTSPTASQENMKAVTWLTNTSNWDSLKTGSSLANKVNYVVGAPSVEMMFDSYNTKYGLTNGTMNTGKLTADTPRVKLFYQYPTTINANGANLGYEVGPQSSSSAKNGYYYWTSDYSVKKDSTIDSMYYPGSGKYYWLSSPSATTATGVLYVPFGYKKSQGDDNNADISLAFYVPSTSSDGGFVTSGTYTNTYALCPLVSLQSSVSLQLQ